MLFAIDDDGKLLPASDLISNTLAGVCYWALTELSSEHSELLEGNGAVRADTLETADIYFLEPKPFDLTNPRDFRAPVVHPSWINASVLNEGPLDVSKFRPHDVFCGWSAVLAGFDHVEEFQVKGVVEMGGGSVKSSIDLLTTHVVVGMKDTRMEMQLREVLNCPITIIPAQSVWLRHARHAHSNLPISNAALEENTPYDAMEWDAADYGRHQPQVEVTNTDIKDERISNSSEITPVIVIPSSTTTEHRFVESVMEDGTMFILYPDTSTSTAGDPPELSEDETDPSDIEEGASVFEEANLDDTAFASRQDIGSPPDDYSTSWLMYNNSIDFGSDAEEPGLDGDYYSDSDGGTVTPTQDGRPGEDAALQDISGGSETEDNEAVGSDEATQRDEATQSDEYDDSRCIFLLLSGVPEICEAQLKALQDLGASVTEDWEHCTHLLASSIRTTDKFLCALGTGAFVLTPTWATDSIAAGELLPEGQYSLKDVDGEQKFGISLVRSRERALALQAPLFQGLKFFFLPSAVDKLAMYSGVIDFYRGQVQGRFKPASRQLGPGKGYMIGAVVDDGWQSLAEAHGIYSVDFITRSILQQQLDTTAFRLQSPEL